MPSFVPSWIHPCHPAPRPGLPVPRSVPCLDGRGRNGFKTGRFPCRSSLKPSLTAFIFEPCRSVFRMARLGPLLRAVPSRPHDGTDRGTERPVARLPNYVELHSVLPLKFSTPFSLLSVSYRTTLYQSIDRMLNIAL